jgi:putative membrane protein
VSPAFFPLLHGLAEVPGWLELHPSVLLGCLALGAGYWALVGPLRRKHGWSDERVGTGRVIAWALGVAIITGSLNGPLHALSDQFLFSAHMVQHILLMLIMPPLLIIGVPPWLIRRALRHPTVRRIGRALTHPGIAFVAYNLVFLGWHFPAAYNAALLNHDLHIVQHLMFMTVAVMMWWPVVAPVPELERIPDGPLLMLYVFAFGIPSTILSAFITMSDGVLYSFYGLAPRISALGPLDDQRLGGLIMWIPGMLIFWIAISAIWFRWTREEYAEWRAEARAEAGAKSRALTPAAHG